GGLVAIVIAVAVTAIYLSQRPRPGEKRLSSKEQKQLRREEKEQMKKARRRKALTRRFEKPESIEPNPQPVAAKVAEKKAKQTFHKKFTTQDTAQTAT